MISDLINLEEARQKRQISLIASENYASADVRAALGSVLTNKYAEGQPGARYYAGNEIVDKIEWQVKALAQKVFQTDYFVNVQAYSGSIANLAIFTSVLKPGDIIMSLDLAHGGHLSHGFHASLTGKLYERYPYYLKQSDMQIDYKALEAEAKELKPKMIVSGTSAYSRTVDFEKIGKIAKKVGALHLADISHISGLVATGLHPTPFGYADFVMTTTHKLLRGPRGALIFCKEIHKAGINKAVFPGLQGGPHMQTIAAIGVALEEALKPSYKKYCQQVLKNAKALAQALMNEGLSVLTNGTDNHMVLIDLRPLKINGAVAQDALEEENIVTNKNVLPFDETGTAQQPNGLRLGTPAVTTLGYDELITAKLGIRIAKLLKSIS